MGSRSSTKSVAEFVQNPFFVRLAVTMVEELPELIDELIGRVVSEDPFYTAGDPSTLSRMRADVAEELGHIVRGFAGLEPLRAEEAGAVARRAAADGVPVAAVLNVYRLGAQIIWERFVDRHRWREAEFDLDTVLEGSAVLWELVNSYSAAISQVYDDTAAERFRRSERERTLLIDGLLEGRLPDLPPMTDVARILDLPRRGTLVVVVAENPASGTEGLADIEGALRFEGARSAWRLRSQRQVGIVVIGGGGPTLARVRDMVEARAGTRVGISPVFTELGETAGAVSLADLALSTLAPGSTGVVLFDDQPIGVLIARSPDLVDRIVQRVLGPVLALEDGAVLLETLGAWIDAGGSTSATGARLFCHRNTVRNRLQRIEELTGRRLSDPTAVAELCVAMKGLALVPPARAPAGPGAEGAPGRGGQL